jgi:hypothetical protein
VRLPARDEDGEPTRAAAALATALRDAPATSDAAKPPVWLLRQVLGTKTGLSTEPLLGAAPLIDGARALEVVDLCQMRLPLEAVGEQLEQGRCALLTGSKFFQGAVFSAAVAVPPTLVARLAAAHAAGESPPLPPGLDDFLSAAEAPPELAGWREALPGAARNEGLLLRWHTALPLVEGVAALPPGRRTELTAAWERRVTALVDAAEHMAVAHTELGIVSVSCTLPGAADVADKAALRRVHAWLAADLSSAPGAAACAGAGSTVLLGQPVDVNGGRAVLRIALGAELLLDLHEGAAERAHEEDAAAVAKLSWILGNYGALDQWLVG